MRLVGMISTAVLSLALGATALAFAQDQQERKEEPKSKPAAQEERKVQPEKSAKQTEKPSAQRQKTAKAEEKNVQQRDKNSKQEEKSAQQQHSQQAKPAEQTQRASQSASQPQRQEQNKPSTQQAQQQNNQRPQRTQQEQRVQQSAWQQHRTQRWDSDHRTWQQRGGYSGYRIPDDRFRVYFGEGNEFRIYSLPFLVVGGYPRFQYNGYWISMVDPWPESWASDWYDTDDVYVVYVDNGYYLFNRRYPNVGMAVSVSM